MTGKSQVDFFARKSKIFVRAINVGGHQDEFDFCSITEEKVSFWCVVSPQPTFVVREKLRRQVSYGDSLSF